MNFVTDVILPLALAFIMFTLGLGLSISDFSNVFKKPKNFLVGLVSQLIFLPIVGLVLVIIWPLPIEIWEEDITRALRASVSLFRFSKSASKSGLDFLSSSLSLT